MVFRFLRSGCRLIVAAGLLVGAWGSQPARAQEFECTVSVDYSQLSGARYTYLDDLKEELEEYINDHTWTEDRFQEHERIQCSMQIVILQALTLTQFQARMVLTSLRPIYGTAQNTRVLQLNESDWQFEYAQGTPLIFEIESFDPLTSLIDFYMYLMLGYDYDTFASLGGTPHFNKARRIVELAQARSAPGWTSVGSDRGRSSLITQLLDPRFKPLREAYFAYHFEGLDHFVAEPNPARLVVLDVLATMDELYQNLSRQYATDLFFNTKYQELAALFEDSQSSGAAYEILNRLDSSHLTEYQRLVE